MWATTSPSVTPLIAVIFLLVAIAGVSLLFNELPLAAFCTAAYVSLVFVLANVLDTTTQTNRELFMANAETVYNIARIQPYIGKPAPGKEYLTHTVTFKDNAQTICNITIGDTPTLTQYKCGNSLQPLQPANLNKPSTTLNPKHEPLQPQTTPNPTTAPRPQTPPADTPDVPPVPENGTPTPSPSTTLPQPFDPLNLTPTRQQEGTP